MVDRPTEIHREGASADPAAVDFSNGRPPTRHPAPSDAGRGARSRNTPLRTDPHPLFVRFCVNAALYT